MKAMRDDWTQAIVATANQQVLKRIFLSSCDEGHTLQLQSFVQFTTDYHICPQLLSRREVIEVYRSCASDVLLDYHMFLGCLMHMATELFSGSEWKHVKGDIQKLELLLFCMDPSGKLFPGLSAQLNSQVFLLSSSTAIVPRSVKSTKPYCREFSFVKHLQNPTTSEAKLERALGLGHLPRLKPVEDELRWIFE